MNSDGSGSPDASETDVAEAVGRGQSAISNRWGRTGEETPGGVAIREDGSINTERFSEGPETELEVTWWNKRLLWKVRREPTGHRVVVARVTENVWRVHLMIAGVIIAGTVLGLVLLGGLPLIYGIVLGFALALVGYGALAWEQRASDEMAGIEEILEMDSVMWVRVRKEARTKYLAYTKEGQEQRYKEAIARARELYVEKYGDETGTVGKTYAANGKVLPVPKFKVPQQITDEFLDEASRLTPDEVAESIKSLLAPARQEVYRRKLLKAYRDKPDRAEAMGRGVRDCGCAACEVQRELKITPELSGAEAARRRAAAAAARQAKTTDSNPASRLEQLRKAARLPRTDDSDTVGDRAESKEARKARAELAKREEALRKDAERQAEKDEKDAQRARREAASARIASSSSDAISDDDGPAPRPRKKNKGHAALISVAAMVSVIVVGLVVVIIMTSSSRESEPSPLVLPESTPSTSSTTAAPTPTSTTPPRPPSNGEQVGVPIEYGPEDPGSQKGGADAIAAYDHAYYVKRSGEEVVSLFAPGVRPDPGPAQNSIDANPIGTRHSLVITPVVVGSEYDVLLKITWPGTPEQEFRQKFFTTYSDGKFYILRQDEQ